MKALVTGGAGFIGSYLVDYILKFTDWDVVVIDKLSYAARGFDRLRELKVMTNPRVKVLTHDLAYPMSKGLMDEIGRPEYVFHLAAESHVDNSIDSPIKFVQSNVVGTTRLVGFLRSRRASLKKFIYMSTDEVFGPALNQSFSADDRHRPLNPYAASKSAGEQMCVAFAHSYDMPITIVHCMNVFGKRQHPEKFIPKAIDLIMRDRTVEIYTDLDGTIGSRFYIHAEDVARALIEWVTKTASLKINLKGVEEVTNYSMAMFIAQALDKELKFEKVAFDLGNSCHDLRYDLESGYENIVSQEEFKEQLREVVLWTAAHKEWLET